MKNREVRDCLPTYCAEDLTGESHLVPENLAVFKTPNRSSISKIANRIRAVNG